MHEAWLYAVSAAHVLLALGIIGWLFNKSSSSIVLGKKLALSLCILLLPVLGVLFAASIYLAHRQMKRQLEAEGRPALGDLIVSVEDEPRWERNTTTQQSMEILPLEDALLHSNVSSRRRMLLNALKTEAIERSSLLEAAVSNEDTETSHYAVTAVMEEKRRMTIALQRSSQLLNAHPNEADHLAAHAIILKKILESAMLDSRTYAIYQRDWANVLERWIEIDPEAESAYQDIIEIELECGNANAAFQWCERYKHKFPKCEIPYLVSLKVSYYLRDRRLMMKQLELLKQSGVSFSPEALQTVRYWEQEQVNSNRRNTVPDQAAIGLR